jgi:hypothetical protein
MPSITLTRQQLYDRAWSTPLDTLANELGLSGRGLGKPCERHGISVPPRGSWAKKAARQRVQQTPLPPAVPGAAAAFRSKRPEPEELATESAPETHALVLCEREDDNRIEVNQSRGIGQTLGLDDVSRMDQRRVQTAPRQQMQSQGLVFGVQQQKSKAPTASSWTNGAMSRAAAAGVVAKRGRGPGGVPATGR